MFSPNPLDTTLSYVGSEGAEHFFSDGASIIEILDDSQCEGIKPGRQSQAYFNHGHAIKHGRLLPIYLG